MKVKDLIARLQEMDPDVDIAILDGTNGDGNLRRINYGPHKNLQATLQPHMIEDCSDFEHMDIGTKIYYMGFGCY